MTLDDGESILQYVEMVILDLVVHRMFFLVLLIVSKYRISPDFSIMAWITEQTE